MLAGALGKVYATSRLLGSVAEPSGKYVYAKFHSERFCAF